jgi:hypothetical protein
MSDNDMIRRGDVLDAMCKGPRTVQERIDAIRSIEPQPDPRDQMIAARVTDAAILEIWGLSQQYDDFDPVFRAKIRAALAAAKAVMK